MPWAYIDIRASEQGHQENRNGRLMRCWTGQAFYLGQCVPGSTFPGHGAPAILACLWLEDSLSPFIPQYPRNLQGLKQLITKFSVPSGFPR